jgi:DNA-binding transcriptional ArsR family regulator
MPHRFSAPPRRGRVPSKPGASTGQVQSLTRGLSILETLSRAEGGLTLTDIGQRAGLAPSTAHRLLATLEKTGYVYRQATSACGTSASAPSPSARASSPRATGSRRAIPTCGG